MDNSTSTAENDKLTNAIHAFFNGDDFSLIEREFGNEGKKVVNFFIENTIRYFCVFILLFVIVLAFFPQKQILVALIVFILFISLPIIRKLFIKSSLVDYKKKYRYFFNHISHISPNKSKEGSKSKKDIIWSRLINQIKEVSKSFWNSFCIRFFSFKTIWLWVLVIGILSALYSIDFNINVHEEIDNAILLKFVVDFVRSLILVIVSYIATNILQEVINVRGDYRELQSFISDVKDIGSDVKDIGVNLPDFKSTLSQGINSMDVIIQATGVSTNYKMVIERIQQKYSNNESNNFIAQKKLIKITNDYMDTLSKFYETIKERLTGDQYIDAWLISSFKSIANCEISNIVNSDTITSDFSTFGNMIKDCLSDSKIITETMTNKIKIYTTIVLTPHEFIDYSETFDSSKPPKEHVQKQKMQEWKSFLKEIANTKENNPKVDIKRHFIICDTTDESVEKSPELIKLIFNEKWKQGLEEKYKVIEGGNTLFFDTETHKPQKEDTGESVKYFMENYHSDGGLFFIKLKDEFFKSDNEFAPLLLHEIKHNGEKIYKPVDLFCIGIENETKQLDWKLCLKAVYDRDLNVVKIIISPSIRSPFEWDRTRTKLTKLFIKKPDISSGIEIVDINQLLT